VEAVIEEGGESVESNYVEHPIDDSDSPPIRRTVKGRVYSRLSTIDRGPRTKRIASKHLCPLNYTTLYIRIAYTNSTLHTTLL
jgi:hypothetical protein